MKKYRHHIQATKELKAIAYALQIGQIEEPISLMKTMWNSFECTYYE